MNRVSWCAVALLCASLPPSCKKPEVDGAFFVDVIVSKSAAASCVVLEIAEQNVAAPSGPRRVELILSSTPKSRTEANGDAVYSVDIRQNGLAPDVSIAALSRTEDCRQPAGQVNAAGESVESSEAKQFSVGKALTLYVGTPCVPSGPELCFDGLDNDCKNGTDCEDMVACTAGAQCGVNGAAGAKCQTGQCVETECGNKEDDDRDGLRDCEDSDCAMAKCAVNGNCEALSNDAGIAGFCRTETEAGQCDDGQDNDRDTLVDCQDPDCPANSLCTDGRSCTAGDKCGADKTCMPGVIQCPAPDANLCQANVTPVCDPAAGGTCVYAKAAAGTTCDDKNLCSTSSTCSASGMCTARTFVACNTPPPGGCFEAAGMCQVSNGICVYTPRAQGVDCSTPNSCTEGQTCDGAGTCSAGTPKVCPAQTDCKTASTCANGTCSTPANRPDFLDCDSGMGLCLSGTCVPKVVPSNVTVTDNDFSGLTSDLTIGNGVCTINTDMLSGAAPSCLGNSAFSKLVSRDQNGAGAGKAAVLFVRGLTVNGSLKAVGALPLIVVAKHFIEVSGSGDIDVSSEANAARAAAGARTAAGCVFIGADGTTNSTAKISSGGAGGSFGTLGGSGGNATNTDPRDVTLNGGAAGAVNSNGNLTPLVGGCAGGDGGNKLTSGPNSGRGLAGKAGGALQLTAGARVVVAGRLLANASGGTGGLQDSNVGGGGGGSGGALFVEAPVVSIQSTSRLVAMGSGGGAGMKPNTPQSGDGLPGQNDGKSADGGDSSSASTNCVGGRSAGSSGGAFVDAAPGGSCSGKPEGSVESITGGGGGGGVGIIRVKSQSCNFTERFSGLVLPNAQGTCPR
jgi:hypothetical protein